MTVALDLEPTECDLIAEIAADGPTVFVRVVSAPPGPPWDQTRSVALEARVGAPLPLSQVSYRLHRLDPWGWGRPARFAVCYARTGDWGRDVVAKVELDGRSVEIRFRSAAERDRRARQLALVGGIAVACVLSLAGAVTTALSLRGETEARLEAAEQTATVRLREAEADKRESAAARLLTRSGAGQTTLDTVLADLAWASTAKAPDAHIDAVHWEHGYTAVETRGDTAPFNRTDRAVSKAQKPVRPGVWLWGFGPAGAVR